MAQDLEKNLYESFHFNFVEPLSRALLEELAAGVAKDGTGELVTQVSSPQSSSFILCLRSECLIVVQVGVRPIPFLHLSFTPTFLFGTSTTSTGTSERSSTAGSFDHTHILSYPQFPSNDRAGNRSRDREDCEWAFQRGRDFWFALSIPQRFRRSYECPPSGLVPYIRCPKGNAAEMVARKLEQKIRDAIISSSRSHTSSTLFAHDSTGLSNLQRPCAYGLILFRRHAQLTTYPL
jgi:hypothetical protein